MLAALGREQGRHKTGEQLVIDPATRDPHEPTLRRCGPAARRTTCHCGVHNRSEQNETIDNDCSNARAADDHLMIVQHLVEGTVLCLIYLACCFIVMRVFHL
jgi:hypothetical protein